VASAAGVKLKAAPKQTGANMTLAARAVGDRRSRRATRVALPRLEVLEVDEGQCKSSGENIERGEGIERDAELGDRTESYLTGAGEGMFGTKPGSSSNKSECLPKGECLPQPWVPSCERSVCAATAREARPTSRKKRVCSESEDCIDGLRT